MKTARLIAAGLAAWALVKYLATNTDALVAMANSIRNVPTTYPSLESPDLQTPTQFQTFLDIFAHPGSHYKQKTDIAWGNQIRSYVFQPYTLVNDHRTEMKVGDGQKVMDGDLDPFIESYRKRFGGGSKAA